MILDNLLRYGQDQASVWDRPLCDVPILDPEIRATAVCTNFYVTVVISGHEHTIIRIPIIQDSFGGPVGHPPIFINAVSRWVMGSTRHYGSMTSCRNHDVSPRGKTQLHSHVRKSEAQY